jgi:hypothetical protein
MAKTGPKKTVLRHIFEDDEEAVIDACASQQEAVATYFKVFPEKTFRTPHSVLMKWRRMKGLA